MLRDTRFLLAFIVGALAVYFASFGVKEVYSGLRLVSELVERELYVMKSNYREGID